MSEQSKLTMADVKLLNADIAQRYAKCRSETPTFLWRGNDAGQVLSGMLMLKAIERGHDVNLLPYDAVHQARKNFAEWTKEFGNFSAPCWQERAKEDPGATAKALAADFLSAANAICPNTTLADARVHIAHLKKIQAQASVHEGTLAPQVEKGSPSV